jgi:ribosomal protein L7/L12
MPATVVEFARAGNLIGAIKKYRRITGAGLADAKKAVEDIR